MSYLLNDPDSFVDEMTEGFVLANPALVRRVTGGVARTSRTMEHEVAVVIGGGSGHYPAFAGLVGQGLAHGAAMGNVFASPSGAQIHAVAKAVAGKAGVLLTYGNYAGDVLNFDQAEQRLRDEGISCRTVVVTDDICSAPEGRKHERRGIAGDLGVFRAAAFAAEQGLCLDEVWTLASHANDRVRSIGVAFSGCTLPGASKPLFEVPAGSMAVGMGIHGEPGLEERPLPRAEDLAVLLVDRLLESAPPLDDLGATRRVAVILNGLGAIKNEELFVLYSGVAAQLSDHGLEVVEPDVGELVTSFEMAGVSLSLMWLDEELERAWSSAALSPAYRKDGPLAVPGPDVATNSARVDQPVADFVGEATDEARGAALVLVAALGGVSSAIEASAEELGRLDSVAGDGDHGLGMCRGTRAARRAAKRTADAGGGLRTVLASAAAAWADQAGGTSGALWGVGLDAAAARFDDNTSPTAGTVVAAVQAAVTAIGSSGKAQLGDKTMLDALIPFAETLDRRVENGEDLSAAWDTAAETATQAARSTADLTPRLGRARTHAESSRGTPDPGAVSLALAVTAGRRSAVQATIGKENTA